jgi:SAM-dependent methyltransferase
MNAPAKCPICDSGPPKDFLFRGQVPVHQNLLMRDQSSATDAPRGDLALCVCEDCGFIFNRAFDPAQPLYGEDYENSQACSPSFNEYLDGLVRHMILERGVRDCQIVEAGCGNGLFLRKLVTYQGSGNRGYGFDPSYRGAPVDLGGRLNFATRYYDAECAGIPADVVVCRHVIEHVPRPLDLLRDVRNALGEASTPRLFFETPCAEWILRNQVIWDFTYEHCSYFTAQSLTTAFETAGFQVDRVMHVFGGQYLWLEGTLPAGAPAVTKEPGKVGELAASFARAEAELMGRWKRRIESLAAHGPVALWGAGGKGVTFANIIDRGRCLIDSLVDLNPSKQGYFVPGTGHPIIGVAQLAARGVKSVILMNPNYRDEVASLLSAARANVRLIEHL